MKNLLYITAICILVVLSCKKKDDKPADDTPTTTTTGSTPAKPNNIIAIPSDADAVLVASTIPYTFTNNTTTTVGNASAFFYTSPSNYTYIDAGTVTCNDSALTKLSGGSYSFMGHAVNGQTFSGIHFGSSATWSVSSPSFTYAAAPFPTPPTMTSGTQLYKNQNYVLQYSGVTNADSVAIILSCDSQTVRRVMAASTTSVSFLASEVASVKKALSTNKGYFNVTPCKLTSTTVSGKKYYFLNACTSTFTVNIQ